MAYVTGGSSLDRGRVKLAQAGQAAWRDKQLAQENNRKDDGELRAESEEGHSGDNVTKSPRIS